MKCCEDIDLVDTFICIDDNSSESDRAIMKEKFPFFEYIFKGPESRGHFHSMNLIVDIVRERRPKYLIHLEDDFEFFSKRKYFTDARTILENNTENIKQVVFNKDYSTSLKDVRWGSVPRRMGDLKYRLHIHIPEGKHAYSELYKHIKNRHCIRWPHYSLNPSFIDPSIFDELGHYGELGSFEYEYALKYYRSGFKTAFFDEITCNHIGMESSYNLNSMDQRRGLKFENTTIITKKKGLIRDRVKQPLIVIDNTLKDGEIFIGKCGTRYIGTQCTSILGILKIAMDLNVYDTKYFCWVDTSLIRREININPTTDKIRMGIDCGVIRDELVSIGLINKDKIQTSDDIWVSYINKPELFDPFYTSNNLLDNYQYITKEIPDILRQMEGEDVATSELMAKCLYNSNIIRKFSLADRFNMLKAISSLDWVADVKLYATDLKYLIEDNDMKDMYTKHKKEIDFIFEKYGLHIHHKLADIDLFVDMLKNKVPFAFCPKSSKENNVFTSTPCSTCDILSWIKSNEMPTNKHVIYNVFSDNEDRLAEALECRVVTENISPLEDDSVVIIRGEAIASTIPMLFRDNPKVTFIYVGEKGSNCVECGRW